MEISHHAARCLLYLHSNALCHGGMSVPNSRPDGELTLIDFTASNMALRLADRFESFEEGDLQKLFGPPPTAPVRTYSGKPPGPHAPDYVVVSLDFCPSATNLLSSNVCVIDFDQPFVAKGPLPGRLGIPAKYLAPEVVVGPPASPAADIWAIGCAIFRIQSGDDIFFDYDTDRPVDAPR